MSLAKTPLLVALFASTAFLGCTAGGEGETGGSCEGDKCDDLDKPDSEVEATPCDGIMVDRSGRGNEKVAGRLHDPMANAAFRSGDDCPVTFQDMVAKLRVNDAEGCDGSPGAGMLSRAISESAQVMGAPTSYRMVTSRNCGGRSGEGIMFSLFGIRAGAASMPANVEVIAFDESAGVFNYYETDGETLNFFGNSKDMLKGTGDGDDRRCAGCHTGGGLIMKELRAPWLHWEGDTTTPGVAELISAHEDLLGQQSDGIELEATVASANSTWNAKRLEILKEVGDTREILRPLFCTVEINIGSSGPFGVSFPSNMLVDPQLGFVSVSVDQAIYDELIAANGQRVGSTGKSDTFFPWAFAERATADSDFVAQLVNAGIVDDELVRDVLMVDFTRPVFSDDRCGLLDSVPSIPVAELNPTSLRDGMLAGLASAAAGSPQEELRKNLEATGGHDAMVQNFGGVACAGRDGRDLLADALRVTSLNRAKARELQVIEFKDTTMPVDNLNVADGTRFDPLTCELTTEFVPVAGQPVGLQLGGSTARRDEGATRSR
jgi:hypothetical protein